MHATEAPAHVLPWITALAAVQRLGGRVWAAEGALRVQVPRPLPVAVQTTLQAHKPAILAWLARCAGRDAAAESEAI